MPGTTQYANTNGDERQRMCAGYRKRIVTDNDKWHGNKPCQQSHKDADKVQSGINQL